MAWHDSLDFWKFILNLQFSILTRRSPIIPILISHLVGFVPSDNRPRLGICTWQKRPTNILLHFGLECDWFARFTFRHNVPWRYSLFCIEDWTMRHSIVLLCKWLMCWCCSWLVSFYKNSILIPFARNSSFFFFFEFADSFVADQRKTENGPFGDARSQGKSSSSSSLCTFEW